MKPEYLFWSKSDLLFEQFVISQTVNSLMVISLFRLNYTTVISTKVNEGAVHFMNWTLLNTSKFVVYGPTVWNSIMFSQLSYRTKTRIKQPRLRRQEWLTFHVFAFKKGLSWYHYMNTTAKWIHDNDLMQMNKRYKRKMQSVKWMFNFVCYGGDSL